MSDWANHISTIFPEVRLKRYLEMRGSDGGPWRVLPSLPAFWCGILYDDDCLDAAWDIAKDWTAEERQKLRDDVPKLGFKATIRNPRPAQHRDRNCCALRARACSAARGSTTTAATRRAICGRWRRSSPAASRRPRRCWRNIQGDWDGSTDPIYTEFAY